MYTLSLIFSKDHTKVLTIYRKDQEAYNFVGGKVEEFDANNMSASYRELHEKVGLSQEDVSLQFIRLEKVSSPLYHPPGWELFITAGVLEGDIATTSAYPVRWVPVDDMEFFVNMFGNGNSYLFLREAKLLLGIE